MAASDRSPEGRAAATDDPALVVALAAGATYAEAAAQAGVSERTARRRMDDPAFRAALDDARAEVVSRAVDRLSAVATDAVDTLAALLGPGVPPPTRLGAARAVLELGSRLREEHDLAARLGALEEALAPNEQRRTA